MINTRTFMLWLTALTAVIALIVIVLGAYTRLSHAGLGCPDWPGCYGRLIIPEDQSYIDEANNMFPDRPLETGKAWKEMVHRYAAGALGLLILTIAMIAWKGRKDPDKPFWIPMMLLALVIFQALLGMWTVTLLLKPIIVMGHLLGGMSLLLLLVWLFLSQYYQPLHRKATAGVTAPSYSWAILVLLILYLQISLGGWTSANYAALACPDLPQCQGQWMPPMDFQEGFLLWRGLGVDYEYGVLDPDARTAIHFSHRIGAIITLLVISLAALRCLQVMNQRIKNSARVVLILLFIQFGLGIANILFTLPIYVATAHNGMAALLLASIGVLLFFSRHATLPQGTVGTR
jgi:cytochrome c oxidase assembly protein subunit 15